MSGADAIDGRDPTAVEFFSRFELGQDDGDLLGGVLAAEGQGNKSGHGFAITNRPFAKTEVLGDDDPVQLARQRNHAVVGHSRMAFADVDDVMSGGAKGRDKAGGTAFVQKKAQV